MSFIKSIEKIKDKVEYLLENYPHLRDCDNKLIANIWLSETKSIQKKSLLDFLKDFSKGKYTHPSSIKRCRRKIQENTIHLRGQNYASRKEQEIQTRMNIN